MTNLLQTKLLASILAALLAILGILQYNKTKQDAREKAQQQMQQKIAGYWATEGNKR